MVRKELCTVIKSEETGEQDIDELREKKRMVEGSSEREVKEKIDVWVEEDWNAISDWFDLQDYEEVDTYHTEDAWNVVYQNNRERYRVEFRVM